MDVFQNSPSIPEDTLQYTLYLPQDNNDKLSATTFAACIQEFVVSSLPANFIWHRDAFELKVVQDPESDACMLSGRMRVGDCVDDEWCVVWLLQQVSSKWDVVIGVFDSDGEFLLIEAAESLPAWVKPTNSENRVWIYASQLHLVPISHVSPPSRKRRRRRLPGTKESDDEGEGDADIEDWIAAVDAVGIVRDNAVDTIAPAGIQKTVWERIASYPDAAREHVHTTKAWVPVDVARALAINPGLIQKPVETFYTRDAVQLRSVHRMLRFPPAPAVLATVKLTRTAYAQLVGQKFYPPKVFGLWSENEGSNEWRWRDVGMKIASGFEILHQESKGRTDASTMSMDALKSSASARKEALRRNPDYVKYIQNLVSANYFQGEIEGSELWSEKENKAAAAFVESRREDDATRQSFAAQVTAAIAQTTDMHIAHTQDPEDSDDWLNIDAQDFEIFLEETMGKGERKAKAAGDADAMDVDGVEEETEEDQVANEQADRLKNLAAKVEKFVEGKGDLEGARFDDEQLSDDESGDELDEFSDEKMSDSDDDSDDREARQIAMDKLVPSLAPSEYGTMPASFHSNSQRVALTTIATDVVDDGANAEDPPLPDLMDLGTIPEDEEIPPPPSTSGAPPPRNIRKPMIPRDKYDGVDSDDETDSGDENHNFEVEEDEEDEEEDKPVVVGDIEVDMNAEEEEFLEFSRQALGISSEQWGEIVNERKGRGAFIPSEGTSKSGPSATKPPPPTEKLESASEHVPRVPQPGPRPNANPNLDSFEAVMLAMDEELKAKKKGKGKAKQGAFSTSTDKGKQKAKATSVDDKEDDILASMDAELKAVLMREGADGSDEEDDEQPMDYGLIKNFLESFKSQAGLAGPVGNLAGRLQPEWKLPRDES